MKSYESPFWDMNDFHTKYGILDYKGEVIYFTAEVYSNDGNLSWYVKEFDTDEKIDEKEEFLVKALEVYKAEGYPELWSIIDKENPDQRTTNRYVKSVVVYFEI